jgi:hypothetical protein
MLYAFLKIRNRIIKYYLDYIYPLESEIELFL